METNQLKLHVEPRQLISEDTNGDKFTTSLIIAEATGKQHKNVLADIKKILDNDEIDELNFQPIFYSDSYSREKPAYQVSRDGFTYLMAKYTGKKARKFLKELSVEFNRREVIIKEKDEIITDQNVEIQTLRLINFLTEKTLRLEADLEFKTKHIEIQAVHAQRQETVIKIQAPKAEYYDKSMQNKDLINTGVIADELGVSAKYLNKLLYKESIQYMSGTAWVLYKKYKGKGYTGKREYVVNRADGTSFTSVSTGWTSKGRKFIKEFYELYTAPRAAKL